MINWALASNGCTASASPVAAGSAAAVINGVRNTANNWPTSGLDTGLPFPAAVPLDLGAARAISEIDIFTLKDAVNYNTDPTLSDTFSLTTGFGITAYRVESSTDNVNWTTRVGPITGNNKVWRQHTFSPVTARYWRLVGTDSVDHASIRLVEFEVWGAPAPPSITDTSLPNGVEAIPYTHDFAGANGSGTTKTWSYNSGTTTPSITVNAAGHLTDSDTSIGPRTVTVTLTDEFGQSDTKTFTYQILPPALGKCRATDAAGWTARARDSR